MRNTLRLRDMLKCESSGPACPGRRAVRGAAAEQSLAFGLAGRSPDGTSDRVCGAVRLRRQLADVEVSSAVERKWC